jgi:hypothetical protein
VLHYCAALAAARACSKASVSRGAAVDPANHPNRPRRPAIGEPDFIAAALRHGLVFDQADCHGQMILPIRQAQIVRG